MMGPAGEGKECGYQSIDNQDTVKGVYVSRNKTGKKDMIGYGLLSIRGRPMVVSARKENGRLVPGRR